MTNFILLLDYDSVDKVILARPHIIGEHRLDVKKAIPKDQRQFQAQQQQQQQYALQMQAAAATAYYYNHSSYPILTNHLGSPFTYMTQHGALFDDTLSHSRTSNHNNNQSNSYRHLSARNTRQQSSHSSQ